VVSACLLSAGCRWDADIKSYPHVIELIKWAAIVPVCPEMGAGMGVPRDPIRLVRRHDGTRLIQPSTGRDLTGEMASFRNNFLNRSLSAVAFIMKSRSPSCAVRDADLFDSADAVVPMGKGPGAFTAGLETAFDGIKPVVTDERALLDETWRKRFMEILFEKQRDIT
jgi:uncharacterized protein YbbK (DUF523 family)